ncbi:MAG TPA: zinc ribbon domain-containing protein [Gammaproteobacteria bacterium]|nr:zinc ribbon domain-containing protein [Gammaproteobacteria bacterium]HRA42151.1 zinc ribbon domain-containing protein [Gammaproteobacteria bacterium]
MPIYEYVCTACGATLEVFQGMKDVPLTDCRVCTKPTLQKLISATGFRLKGDGWYATGYETDLKKDNDKKKNLIDSTPASTSTPPASSAPNTSESVKATASASNASKTETSV